MHPILFRLGPIRICTYGLMIAIGFLSAIAIIVYTAKRESLNTERLIDLAFFVILSGIVGARLLYVIMNLPEYLRSPLKIINITEGGLVIYGGIIAALIITIILIRRYSLPFWRTVDILTPALALAQGIGRIGCFFAGCCYGLPTQRPWGVIFRNPDSLAPLGVTLHPTQIYHAISNFSIFIILFYILRKRKDFDGQIFSLYLCLYPAGRFIMEFFRADSMIKLFGIINLTQGISLLVILGGICLYFGRKYYLTHLKV